MAGWYRHMTRWLAPATPVLLVSRPQDAMKLDSLAKWRPGRPTVAQFDSAATGRTPGRCKTSSTPAAPLGSMHGWRRNEPHPVAYRHSAQGRPIQRWSVRRLSPTPRPQDACGRQLQALRATMQHCCRSGNEVNWPRRRCSSRHRAFLQYQQSCRLGQGLVFTTQLLLQLPDALLVRLGLCLLRLL